MLSKSPAFNLKAVLHETGLAADTLRAWERRYGLPVPQRTAGGHRLYSQYDIETIKWLIARQAEGLSISRAVDLWNEMTASGSDPLAGLSSTSFAQLTGTPLTLPADTTLDAIRAEWLEACMNFSETQAEQALNRAFSMFPVESVCIEVLQKGMSEMGMRWYQNQASVQQEHFASSLAMRRLDALLSASPAPTRNLTILIGCPPTEWHTFTPLLLALLLRRRGLNVIYLGANVPPERFAETALRVKANLVVLVAQTLISASHLQHVTLALYDQNIPIAFGGRIFSLRENLVDYIPGNFLGNILADAVQEVENLLLKRSNGRKPKSAAPEYLSALYGFNSKRTHIESTLKLQTAPPAISPDDFSANIQYLGDNISAALRFGDMEHLSEEMEWLKTLLQSYQHPKQELLNFMNSYSQAVDAHIKIKGDPIKMWLRAYAQENS